MNFCSIEGCQIHLLKLIDWLYNEVKSAGGDGDALWYSKYYDTADLLPLVKEYNEGLKRKWTIDYTGGLIHWWNGQEGILITNKEEVYKSAPSWQQCIVVL